MRKTFISQNIGKETFPYSIQLFHTEGEVWGNPRPFKNVVWYTTSASGHQSGESMHFRIWPISDPDYLELRYIGGNEGTFSWETVEEGKSIINDGSTISCSGSHKAPYYCDFIIYCPVGSIKQTIELEVLIGGESEEFINLGTLRITHNLIFPQNQYKSIEVHVNDFGAQRTNGCAGSLIAFPNKQEAKLCLLSQDSGRSISEELALDEGRYSDLTPVFYPQRVYTKHQPWGQNAHYSLVKEMGSPILLKPELTYFTFTAMCRIEVDGIEIHDMDNIGRVNVTIRNIDTNEIETHNDVDCQLVMSSSWGFVTAVSLPKWENIEINFEVFSAEMRI